jgi:hypothetical protein
VKRTGRDETIGVVIHICMETTQGNSLCRYLYLKLAKTSWLSFYTLCIFFYKIREQKGGTDSAPVGKGWISTRWKREMVGKGMGG